MEKDEDVAEDLNAEKESLVSTKKRQGKHRWKQEVLHGSATRKLHY